MKSVKRLEHNAHQRGMSSPVLLIVLMVAGLAFLCVSRMAPAYMDNQYAVTALKDLSNSKGELGGLSDYDIKKKMNAFFLINRVNQNVTESLKIDRRKGGLFVTMDYEVRVPIIYNIDVVMTFKNHWDSKNPENCCKPEGEIESQ